MSYLLDAIRKAEKQRHDDSVPTLEGLVSERRVKASRSRKGRLIWILLLVVIALSVALNLSLIARWWERAETAVSEVVDRVSDSWQIETAAQSRSNQTQPDAATPTETATAAETETAAPVTTAETEAATPTPATTAVSTSATSALTDAQRALIGQIDLAVISYSTDDEKRFVMVGSEVLREGDLLEGFEVTRIQADGVVIEVDGAGILVRP